MKSWKKEDSDKRKRERERGHLVRPPRLEGKQKNAGMNPKKKKPGKGKLPKVRKTDIPKSPADETRFSDRKA